MKIRERLVFLGLAGAGVFMAGVAVRETSAEATSVSAVAVVRAANVFTGLKECEIPGVRERLLAKGVKTMIYAGDFGRTRTISWTSGQARIFLYIVSGNGVVYEGNKARQAGPGDFFVIPKGARHAVSATSPALRAVYFEDRT